MTHATKLTLPRVVAHRGLSSVCPENTLPAFGAALAVGVEEIELDLWLSRDEEVVVCHDETVDRTSNGSGQIRELTWQEIATLDAGSWFDARWAGVRFCRLEEVLSLCGNRAVLNLHLKETGAAGLLVRRVTELVEQHRVAGSVYLTGEREVLSCAVALAPHLERCCLEGQHDQTIVDHALTYQCHRVQFWNPNFTDELIARAHSHGMLCNLFYCDDPQEARLLFARGIDALLTNCAHQILPVAKEMAMARRG